MFDFEIYVVGGFFFGGGMMFGYLFDCFGRVCVVMFLGCYGLMFCFVEGI